MNTSVIDPLVTALLYEGYLLYPYRRAALKNRYRWTFGCIVPRAYSEAQRGTEMWSIQVECLLRGSLTTTVDVEVRFLQLCGGASDSDAVERSINPPGQMLGDLMDEPRANEFSFASADYSLKVMLELSAREVGDNLFTLRVRILNDTLFDNAATTRDEALLHSLVSTHAILQVADGEFISLQAPPEELQTLVATCRNQGSWPVLAGEPGQTDMMLCAPIILADYPRIAPESPGDFFDGTEIDELLTLRIQTLTDQEKLDMAESNARSRAMLQRVESLERDRQMQLHGAIRECGGIGFKPGDRVRLRPRRRADAFDLLLVGMIATVVSVEQDFENRVFLAVTVDDDPGHDLGVEGKPGHRFFFGIDEVERA